MAVEVAFLVLEVLDDLGLPFGVKTTGGKGLHVVVPIERRVGQDELRAAVTRLTEIVVERRPDLVTAAFRKAKRGGRVMLDPSRNGTGATIVALYSAARAGGRDGLVPRRARGAGDGLARGLHAADGAGTARPARPEAMARARGRTGPAPEGPPQLGVAYAGDLSEEGTMKPEDELPSAPTSPPPSEWVPPPPEQPAATPPSPATGADLALALVGGLVGAIVGGIAWGYLVRSIDTELGIAAIGVGILAGFGVALLARGKRGVPLQVIAALTAALGILWGKYFAFVLVGRDLLRERFGVGSDALPLFSGDTFSLFTATFADLFSGFDVAWIAFAVYTAWRIPAGQGFGRMAPGARRS